MSRLRPTPIRLPGTIFAVLFGFLCIAPSDALHAPPHAPGEDATLRGRIVLGSREPLADHSVHVKMIVKADETGRVNEEDYPTKYGGVPYKLRGRHRTAPGGRVRISEDVVKTDDEGYFVVAGLVPGLKAISLRYDIPGRSSPYNSEEYELVAGEVRDLGTIVLMDGEPTIHGTVSNPEGKPLAGVYVVANTFGKGGLLARVQTDEKGEFSVWIGRRPGLYQLSANPPKPFARLERERKELSTFPYLWDLRLEVAPPPPQDGQAVIELVLPSPEDEHAEPEGTLGFCIIGKNGIVRYSGGRDPIRRRRTSIRLDVGEYEIEGL